MATAARVRTRRVRRLAHRLVPVVTYAVAGLLAQRTLLPVAATHVYDQGIPGNDSLLHVWTLAWVQHALVTAPARLFDANIFFPQPDTLLYSDHLIGLAVLLSPLRLLTDNVILVHNLAILAAPVLNALAMHALVRDLGLRTGPALVAGLIYGFAPLRLYIDRTQIQMLAAWWPPLMLLWGRRALAHGRRRDAVLAGMAFALQGLSGIYLTAYFLPFLVLAHLAWLRTFPPRGHARGWAALLAAELLGALVLVPFALAYRRVQTDLDSVRSPMLNALLSLVPQSFPLLLPLGALALLLGAALLGRRRLPHGLRAEAVVLTALLVGGVVLAFGPRIALPGGLGSIPGPYDLLVSLPGYNALRAPGRMIHIALIGAAVLAGGGLAAATTHLARGLRRPLVALMLALIVFECWSPGYPTRAAPPPPVLDPVYAWLARQPRSMRLVEVPVDNLELANSVYQYASTWHWHPLLNGNMGIVPPMFPYVARSLSRLPAADVVAAIATLGITHVVHHGPTPLTPSRDLKLRWMRGRTRVYAIRPGLRAPRREPTGHPLERHGWQATASAGADRAARAIDGDATSAWSSWGDLDRAVRSWRWDSVPPLTLWADFLRAQPVRFTVDLGAPAAVTALVTRLGGSDPLALADLVVEGSADGEHWEPLPGGLEPLPDILGLVEQAAEARMGLLLPTPQVLRAVRLSCQTFEWHLADLTLYGPDPTRSHPP